MQRILFCDIKCKSWKCESWKDRPVSIS